MFQQGKEVKPAKKMTWKGQWQEINDKATFNTSSMAFEINQWDHLILPTLFYIYPFSF